MPEPNASLAVRDLVSMLGAWRSGEATLGIGLASAIAHLVEAEKLADGVRLPAQRALAAELGISRGTVTTAYEILAGGGYVTAEVGRGSTVSPPNRHRLRLPGSAAPGVRPIAVDLSTQSLPAGDAFAAVLSRVGPTALRPYLQTDGHHALGLPALRAALARHLTRAGIPTAPEQILVTAGAQQALWLAVHALTERGDTVLVEDPTYRGVLAVLAGMELRVEARPADDYTLAELRRPPAVAYLQSSVHSPTGQVRSGELLRALAATVNRTGLLMIEDRSAAELVHDAELQNTGLAGQVAPERLVTIGTLSKLFWGGLRVGWIRSEPSLVARIADLKQTIDITTSVVDQFLAAEALLDADSAIAERRLLLLEHTAATLRTVTELRPEWRPLPPEGGSGLWVDTGADAIAYAMAAQSHGIRIAAGPAFSVRHGFGTHIRLPIWHPPGELANALAWVR
ncbi:aminotransferase-like domain-containing protein [Nocardia harenae]|uniref:aminotransferase-like domain-containing protein n=1 Tax=Nocardia harenae TaxID=358707 RepID=UPI000A063DCB|nr:PLP-dependent aminotransferase family protein [Nocardia harenae]